MDSDISRRFDQIERKIEKLQSSIDDLEDGYSSPFKKIENNFRDIKQEFDELKPSLLRKMADMAEFHAVIIKIPSLLEEIKDSLNQS